MSNWAFWGKAGMGVVSEVTEGAKFTKFSKSSNLFEFAALYMSNLNTKFQFYTYYL